MICIKPMSTVCCIKYWLSPRLTGFWADLENLGSSVRVKGYVDHLVMRYQDSLWDATHAWLDTLGRLFGQTLRMLPLARLTHFVLAGNWIRHIVVDGTLRTISSGVLRCIQDICAWPMLRTLTMTGKVPFLPLLSHCGPSLKELYTSCLPVEAFSQFPSPLGRQVAINLETLLIDDNYSNLIPSYGLSFYDCILDPQALFSLNSLRWLEISGNRPFDKTLSSILHTCAVLLEELRVSFWSA
ncbi:hypothetical protein BKA70DRAFT_1499362 [Coprinopsis sp. MPI-PUGE-AT-0042]|nr:hypothetical protein BKA70DRAFT_1499362 [Coprinopsis sp. MPI-PUGE-AT-0042]